MLPAGARLRHRPDLTATLRLGRRGAGRSALVVVHLLAPPGDDLPISAAVWPRRAAFVVGRAVGGAVVRNRVRRRLRHLVARRLATLPPGTHLVVRALPASAAATSAELSRDLDSALASAERQSAATSGRSVAAARPGGRSRP